MNAPFTELVAKGEMTVLRRLHGMLENKSIETKEQFTDLMSAAFKWCGLEYSALANDLGYSPTSVYRWVEGLSAPHKSLWPKIVDWIMKALEVRMENIEQKQRAVLN